MERVAVPHRGGILSGWLCRPSSGRVHATVIVWGGLSGWGAAYLPIADAYTARGLACLLAEGPGQGESRLTHQLYVDERVTEGFARFVDLVEADQRLDGPIGIQGMSFGGLFAAHLAATDPRVAAVAANGAPAVRPSRPHRRQHEPLGPPMDFTVETATDAVVESFQDPKDPRLRTVLESLTRPLHDFVRDIEPTMEEWEAAIDFLTAVGQTCDDTRQEFVLPSDVLGVSTLVETLNGTEHGTESTVLGPCHMTASPYRELGESIDLMGTAHPCVISGRVTSADGTPLANAELDVWQCTEDGFYDVQQPDVQPPGNGRGLFRTDGEGCFWFRTVVPSHCPIPTNNPVGRLLQAADRHPCRPAHVQFIASADGHRTVTTHAFVADSPYIDSEAVFAVKHGLITDFSESHDTGKPTVSAWPPPSPTPHSTSS